MPFWDRPFWGRRSADEALGAEKLLVVSHDAHFHGGQLLALYLVRFLKESLGLQVSTVLLGDGPLRKEFQALGPVIDFTKPGWDQKAGPAVRKAQREKLKALYRNGYRYAICNTTPSAGLIPLLRDTGFRTLALVHELPRLLKHYDLFEEARNVGLADHVVFPAAFVRDRFVTVANVELDKVVVRPQGLFRSNPYKGQRHAAREDLLRTLNIPDSAKLILAAGLGDRRKGVDIFCQVAAQVVQRNPLAYFLWLGDDETELSKDCKAWLEATGFTNNIRFLGVATDPDLYARRVAAPNLFLLTSREDPFPSVVLDAMTLGIPVVGFAGAGGFCELLAEGAGLLAPFEDRVGMASAVMRVLDNPEFGTSLGQRGQHLIETRFDFGDYVRDLLRLLGVPNPIETVQ